MKKYLKKQLKVCQAALKEADIDEVAFLKGQIKAYKDILKHLPKVTLVFVDDWAGIYVDGILKDQNYSLDESVVLDALGFKADIIMDEEAEALFSGDDGGLPEKLKRK